MMLLSKSEELMEKKTFEDPEVTVVYFSSKDIITSSIYSEENILEGEMM